MFLATASAAASPATATSTAATADFYEQTLGRQYTVDNDAAATIGDNDQERDTSGHVSGGERQGFTESRYVPPERTTRATESVHAAPRDATATPWATGDPESLVDTY